MLHTHTVPLTYTLSHPLTHTETPGKGSKVFVDCAYASFNYVNWQHYLSIPLSHSLWLFPSLSHSLSSDDVYLQHTRDQIHLLHLSVACFA